MITPASYQALGYSHHTLIHFTLERVDEIIKCADALLSIKNIDSRIHEINVSSYDQIKLYESSAFRKAFPSIDKQSIRPILDYNCDQEKFEWHLALGHDEYEVHGKLDPGIDPEFDFTEGSILHVNYSPPDKGEVDNPYRFTTLRWSFIPEEHYWDYNKHITTGMIAVNHLIAIKNKLLKL